MVHSHGQTLIEVENLNTYFSEEHIVKDFNLVLKKGQSLGVVGETGSGKTIALKSIFALINSKNSKVTADKVVFLDGQPLQGLMAKDISMVFQNARMSLNPVKRCGYQIQRVIVKHLGLSMEEAKKKTLDLLASVKISEPRRIFQSFPHEVSGGELQRVTIAMSLSCDPQVVILDEPAASLDKIVQYEIVRLLAELKEKEGLSIIIISHDLEMISNVADHIIHIHKGQIVASQDAEAFFTQPTSEESSRLVGRLRAFRHRDFQQSTDTQPIINCKSIAYQFANGNFAFKNVTFTLYENEVLGVVGESGSGKSSLGKCIANLWKISSGEIESKIDSNAIAYVFQDAYSAMDPELSVKKILNEVLRLNKATKHTPLSLVKLVLLPETILGRKIGQLSGGQRQRVNLARSLAQEPKILICDEITSGLDLNIQFEIVDLLINKFPKITKIFITHDISLAKYACHHLLVMKDGGIEKQGETKDIFENMRSGYTFNLINSIPKVKYFLNR
jgi:peptide/nickel transport system ATP-binding protein